MRSKNKSIKLKSNEDYLVNQNQSRREFFKTVSKIAIPTIAFLGFGSIGRELFALNKKLNSRTPNDCRHSCEGTCSADCAGGCARDCENTCSGNCENSCEGACTGNCEGLSGKSINKSLKSNENNEVGCDCTGCTGTCTGPCKGDCYSSCALDCSKACRNSSSEGYGAVRG